MGKNDGEPFISLPHPRLVITTDWYQCEITGEPQVAASKIGFIPWVPVRSEVSHDVQAMIINNVSISKGLEPLWEKNGKKFTGLRFRVHRVAEGRFAPYEVAPVADGGNNGSPVTG